jgi:TetR/AcrR family transcriptional regulator, repressor of fatR-cypB operon
MNDQAEKSTKKIAILEAALDLIAANGFHGAPTSKIAKRAGVGIGSIYRYFKDKEELIHEVFRHVADEMSRRILKDHDHDAPLREQYITLGRKSFHYLIEHPKVFAFNEQYFNSPYGLSHRRETVLVNKTRPKQTTHPLHGLFEKAKSQQIIKDLPLPVLEALMLGPSIFLIRDICSGLFEMDEDAVIKTIEACWDAVKR